MRKASSSGMSFFVPSSFVRDTVSVSMEWPKRYTAWANSAVMAGSRSVCDCSRGVEGIDPGLDLAGELLEDQVLVLHLRHEAGGLEQPLAVPRPSASCHSATSMFST